jgi:SagB-type dehydrogenase family enzyme
LRAPRRKRVRRPTRSAPAALFVRLLDHAALQVQGSGDIVAALDGYSAALGRFSTGTAERAQELRTGLPIESFAAGRRPTDKEIELLVRRLAARGLVEYRLGRPRGGGADLTVIEPQVPDYWPRMAKLRDTDTLALSRFAYMRRRANELVLESPRAGALFRIGAPKVAAALAALSAPQRVRQLRQGRNFPGLELLALLVDCNILFKVDAAGAGLRADEGDDSLKLWDFHDLLFHTRSTEGRHANPSGALYSYIDVMPPLPPVRPSWPGQKIALGAVAASSGMSVAAKLLRERHSTREFDRARPITLGELAQFLDGAARVQGEFQAPLDHGPSGSDLTYTVRPYPSGGASYELELYLAVGACEGLPRGFYHYDAGSHTMAPIDVRPQELDAMLNAAAIAMGTDGVPNISITIAARFGRVSWKYSSLAYALILKDVGVLMQTFYLMAADMGLGACAIGSTNIDIFAKMTGLELHVEGPVGQFALGRGAPSQPSG